MKFSKAACTRLQAAFFFCQMEETIIHHNDSIATAYRFWSPSFNIHFGYWTWGVNPLNREAMLLALNEEVMNALTLSPGEPIKLLDTGCGTGATLRYFSEFLPLAELHGIGLAPGLIALGKKLNEGKKSTKRIQLQIGDFQKMPFEDNSFDALIAIESVCYGTGKGKAAWVTEASRVLRNGGRIVVVDVFLKSGEKLPWPFKLFLKKTTSPWAIEELGELPAFSSEIRANGLELNSIRNVTLNSIPSAMHFPFVAIRLIASAYLRSDGKRQGKLLYAKALLTSMLIGLCFPFLGYYMVVASKNAPPGDK